MAQVKPFKGLRPVPEKVGEVASPPYDVLNSEEAREKAKDNPLSFLHVVKPEIDLDPAIDLYDPSVYAKGGENLKRLIDQKVLVQDEEPCFYIYKLRMGEHEQVGLVAAASVEDYEQDKIKKHEHTRPDKEQDRVNHINNLNAQTGPVFLTYRSNRSLSRYSWFKTFANPFNAPISSSESSPPRISVDIFDWSKPSASFDLIAEIISSRFFVLKI